MDERERYSKGLEVRRAVLGDAHVDRTLKTKTPFNEEFQDLITRYAWGEIWTRPGLPRHTRSIATLAMLVALNRPDELKLHLRASANNGVTREEIKELLMQCAIYCGVPAANAFPRRHGVDAGKCAGRRVDGVRENISGSFVGNIPSVIIFPGHVSDSAGGIYRQGARVGADIVRAAGDFRQGAGLSVDGKNQDGPRPVPIV